MSFLQDFKAFAMRGNVVDMAIGIVIGVAFGKITSSFVNDVIMPPIGLALGGIDFNHLAITLKSATANTVAVKINYGSFINTIIDFIIVAFCMFLVIKFMNQIMPPPPADTKTCPECLSTISLGAKKCAHCCSSLP
jgi:large conductance mechanosensitive channel